MKLLRVVLAKLIGLFRPGAHRRAFDEELESHLQLHIDDNLRAGMTPDAARRHAFVRLGGVEAIRQAHHERSTFLVVEHMVQDLRLAVRQLAHSPALASTAVFVLGLGLGAATAIFAIVDAALIRPLPYPDPSALVSVTESTPQIPIAALSYEDYRDWKRLGRTLQSLDVYAARGFRLESPSGSVLAIGARVSSGFFRTLGVVPVLGRDFTSSEEQPGGPLSVVLSYAAWQKRFGGDPTVVGRAITLSDNLYTIIGILPAEFQFAPLGNAEFWATLQPTGPCEQRRSCHFLRAVGRLANGATVEAAAAEMSLIAARLERQYPDSNRSQGASVVPLPDLVVGDVRPILYALLGGATLLLVIACVNVASLLLVRGERRARELAVRVALGASRARLQRLFLTDAAVLVAMSSVIAFFLASWTIDGLVALVPADMSARVPFLSVAGLNARVLIAMAAVAGLVTAVLALTPAQRLSTIDPRERMGEGSRGASSRAWRRVGSRFVMLELATAMVLLVGAGLLGKSLHRLLTVDLHFRPERVAALRVALPRPEAAAPERAIALTRDILARAATVPGVASVAATSVLPVSFNGNTDWIRFVGRPYNGEHNEVNLRDVTPAYFRTIGSALLTGRHFTEDDGRRRKVVIINAALARRYFPNQDPVGQRIGDTGLSPDSIKEIVGVVDDIREGPLDAEIWPAVYYPYSQGPDDDFWVVARTSTSPESAIPALVAAVRRAHAGLTVYGESTMADHIAESPAANLGRSAAWLIGTFAALALLLGVVGLYGVVSYATSQRTREIAVRLALGAQQRTVYGMILRDASWLVVVGIVSGSAAAIGAATLLRQLLFNTPPWDAVTIVAVAGMLAVAALAASAIPAHRASAIAPIDALRVE
jgi:predicted permease